MESKWAKYFNTCANIFTFYLSFRQKSGLCTILHSLGFGRSIALIPGKTYQDSFPRSFQCVSLCSPLHHFLPQVLHPSLLIPSLLTPTSATPSPPPAPSPTQ